MIQTLHPTIWGEGSPIEMGSDLGEFFPRLSSRKGSFVSSKYRRNKDILSDKTVLKHPLTSPKNCMHFCFLMWVTVDSKRFKVAIFRAYKKPTSHFKGPRLQGSKGDFCWGLPPALWMSQEVSKRLVYTWVITPIYPFTNLLTNHLLTNISISWVSF